MKKITLLCFLCIFNFVFGKQEKLIQILPKFEKYIEQSMKDWGAPGVAFAVITKDKVVYSKGFGVREYGKNKPVSGDTIFQIASLTKIFTAALTGILESKGILSLEDYIQKYFPEFELSNPAISKRAKIHDLISHRMGLGHFVGDSFIKIGLTPKEIMAKIKLLPLTQTYRKDYGYSNPFFGIMGLVLENASKKKYKQLIDEEIIKPLALKNTSSGISLIEETDSLFNKIKAVFGYEKNVALNHDKTRDNQVICLGLDDLVYSLESTSGINSTANDIAIFLQCLLNNGVSNGTQIIPKHFVEKMFTPLVFATIKPHDMQFPIDVTSNVGYGTGLFCYEYGSALKKIKVYGHMGGYVGQRTLVLICPEENFAFVILTNLGHFNISLMPEALRNKFLDLYLDMPEKDWSKQYTQKYEEYRNKVEVQKNAQKLLKPSAKKADNFYAGKYKNYLYGELTVATDREGIFIKLNNKSCHMEHFNGDEFILKAWEFSKNFSRSDKNTIEFFPTADGRILAYISFLHEGDNPIFEKVG